MKIENWAHGINAAIKRLDSERMEQLLSYNDDSGHVLAIWKANPGVTRMMLNQRYMGKLASPWDEIAIAHLLVIVYTKDNNFEEAYKEQAILANAFLRFFQTQTRWTLDPLITVLQELRQLAHKGDVALYQQGKATTCCEDAARICNKAFTFCVTDRTSTPHESRKWGTYRTVNIVFKCYFKVNRTNLCKNVVRAIEANTDLPQLEEFDMADQVAYRYYQGLLGLLNEDYSKAETELSFAFNYCHYSSPRNQERILTFLLPLRLLKGSFPSQTLLSRFPPLIGLYGPFIDAIQQGNIISFDRALDELESRLVVLGVWLIIVKAREVCLARVFKKCWITLNKPTRVSLSAFHAGLKIASRDSSKEKDGIDEQEMDLAEAECLVANAIYKGFIKGYISHDAGLVVLAKVDPFPRKVG